MKDKLNYCPICKNKGRFINYGDGMMVEEICNCVQGKKFKKWVDEVQEALEKLKGNKL